MADSPVWTKPSDVMRMRKRKSLKAQPSNNTVNTQPVVLSPSHKKGRCGKRKNPFASSPKKRLHLSAGVSTEQTSDIALFSALDDPGRKLGDVKTTEVTVKLIQDSAQPLVPRQDENQQTTHNEVTQEEEEDRPRHVNKPLPFYPYDWSLRTKVRYTSPNTFSWCAPLKSKEEADGIHCALTGNQGDTNQVSLHKHTLYWTHPHLPWFKLFPRIISDNKIGKNLPLTQDDDIQQALLSDWMDSFTSVFHMVRANQCPYLYLCAHSFTVLFRSAVSRGQNEPINAMLTPTSRGLREILNNEGIEFTMPLYTKKSSGLEDTENAPQDDTPNDDIITTDSGASDWLQDLGLDRKKYRSLDPNKVKLQRDTYRDIDNRPESLVHVEGHNTTALFNFLLNCRSCLASSGVQAGIPPTILAPRAFRGGVLQNVKVKPSTFKQPLKDGTFLQSHTLEVSGPVLPGAVVNLNTLLAKTQGSFSISSSVHEPTVPFNICDNDESSENEIENKDKKIEKCDLYEELLANDATGAVHTRLGEFMNGRQAIREFTCTDGMYTWNT